MSYKAYVFDAYGTLFDVHSVKDKIHEIFPDKGEVISQEWRSRQIHYFLVRQLIQGYEPFDKITQWALLDALAYSGEEEEEETVKTLMKQYEKLTPYKEVSTLAKKHAEKKFTIFSNGTRDMLEPLLRYNQLTQMFGLLSANDQQIYKPHPKAYQYAQDELGEKKEEILFFSSNPWDIAGAAQFGFHTAWVNRNQMKWPELGSQPDYIIQNLNEIPD